ncbi:MAG TPA: MFS transporter [Candidatus Limnocylindrales bacterium]|nr:MFS transporter [Candidatus Limnocylindrales bacterium]
MTDPARATDPARTVERTYLVLTVVTTLAASFIWGVNTLFLLDAGLTNTEAFTANAFFTVGQVLFEVPTGVVADTRGRRFSFMLGCATLLVATLLYLVMWQVKAPFIGWALASILLGLGFTFFSGATEAWLVDALAATGHTGHLEDVFGRAQTAGGAAMLVGSVSGGFVAQATSLGVPYLVRAAILGLALAIAFVYMRDLGFTPRRGVGPVDEVREVLRGSIEGGWRNPPVRWLMLAAPFSAGIGIYAFYAFQPYLLQLYGDPGAYGIAGLAAAVVAGAQIVGGLLVTRVRRLFRRRTEAIILGTLLATGSLAIVGVTSSFVLAVVLMTLWALVFAIVGPLRQAFVNGVIPSDQRATVLSFDNLMGSAGGVIAQPALGRAADVFGYGPSYVIAAAVGALAIPFEILARLENAPSDPITDADPEADLEAA